MNESILSVKRYLLSQQRTYALQRAFQRFVWFAAFLLAACAVVQAIFAVFPWIVLPVLWDILLALLAIVSFAIFADSLFLRKPPLAFIARLIETQSGLSHPWLTLSLELFHPKQGESPDLALAVHKQAESLISLIPPTRPAGSARRRFIALAISCTAFASGLLFLQPRCLTFWNLPLSILVPVHARVFPGTIRVRSGAPCTVGLVQSSGYFPSCRLVCSGIDESPEVSRLLSANQSGTFSANLGAVRQSTRYQFALGNTSFPADTIFVVPKPRLQALKIRLVPPRYTGIKPSDLPEGQGNFAAYPGTRAHFFLSAPCALSKAVLTSSDTRDTVALTVSGQNAQGDIVVKSHQVYTFALADTFSQSSDSVPLFSIDVLPDAPPSVLIEKPGRNKDCSPAMRETLWVEGVDDIGLSRLTVVTQRPVEPAVVCSERRFAVSDSLVRLARLELPLNLGRYSLYPGDTLRYWATVCDNRAFGGPQCATSDTFFFRVPTFEEIHNKVANEQDHTEQILQSARKKNSDLKQTISSLIQSTQGSSSLSWEQQQIVSDLKQSLSAQTDSLSAAVESFRDAVSKLSQQGSASEALLSKMSEVQKAIEELRRQYGDSLLFAPKKSGDQLSTRELRESLEKLKKTLPDLANRLETTLRFLRMLKRDQALASLAANAERLAHDQQTAASQPKSGESTSKQENVCKGVDGLLSDIDKSAEGGDSALLSKSELPTLDKVSAAQKALRAELAQRPEPSASDMNAMAASLSSLSDELSSLQSSALARRAAKERDALLEIAHDALSMADMQESIASTPNSPDRSPGETAQLEQNLQAALNGSMNKLNRLSMISPDDLVSMKKSYDNASASVNSQNRSFVRSKSTRFCSPASGRPWLDCRCGSGCASAIKRTVG